jgi:adenosylmethionine-8-amino-7-oxononanoate aminotransferase
MTTTWNAEQLAKADHEHLIHPLQHPVDHAAPVIWARGEGALLWDVTGREYIDGLSGLWNVNVGHGRAELADAAAEQMRKLAFATNYTGSSNEPAIRLADRLSQLAYPSLNTVYFTTGGAESNESAFKTARFYWKVKGKLDKVKVISREHAYHGVTLAAMSATGMPAYWKMFEPRVPGFLHIPSPYPYRFAQTKAGVSDGVAAADLLEEAIRREGADTVAAFIAEPVQGAGGVIVPQPDYFRRIREICTRHDVLFVADEVITGFCRTGRWFGLMRYGVEPDIVVFAKGITSGYLPLGGIMVSDALRSVIESVPAADRWMHAATYSGHPTCCAVGLKNLEIMERERLWERAEAMGQRLLGGLETLREFAAVGDVRGLGMMAAVELVADRGTKAPFDPAQNVIGRVKAEAQKRGLFTRTVRDIVCVAPPLVTTEAQIDRLLDAIRSAIAAVVPARA